MVWVAPCPVGGHDAPMGRAMALVGWMAWVLRRPFDRRGWSSVGNFVAPALAAMLLVAAAAPIVIPLLDAQPEGVSVQQIFDGAVVDPDGWVRLRGRITPLGESATGEPGTFGLLIDAERRLRAVVVQTTATLEAIALTTVTGTLVERSAVVSEELPIEATEAGTPPRVVSDRIVLLDESPKPVRAILWPLAIVPALVALSLLLGSRVGYPIFRPSMEIDVLARPLAAGERVPTAYGGRIGDIHAALGEPAAALLLLRRDPRGMLLSVQPLADDGGPAPRPVLVGGSWSTGRIGWVHTVAETVAALHIRTELVDAIFLFARSAERDRVAAMVTVDR